MLSSFVAAVLVVHLLAVNLASAGPLVCVWLELLAWHGKTRRGETFAVVNREAGRRMAWASLGALLLGVFLGAILLVIYRYESSGVYWATLARFPPKAFGFAIAELVFSLALMAVCAAFWNRGLRTIWLRVGLVLLALLASTNLTYHFPPLMTAISELAARPELVLEDTISRSLVREVMGRSEVLALTVHFLLASVAVSGVALMNIGSSLAGKSKNYQAVVVSGGRIALAPTLLQLPIGMWVLVRTPQTSVTAMVGGDALASSLFCVSIVGAFGLLHSLASIALGETDIKRVHRATILLLLVVAMMVGVLMRSRQFA